MNQINPFQQVAKHLIANFDRDKYDFILHSNLGEIIMSQVVSSRTHDFVTIVSREGKAYVFHLHLLNSFAIEVREEDTKPSKVVGFRFQAQSPDIEVSRLQAESEDD